MYVDVGLAAFFVLVGVISTATQPVTEQLHEPRALDYAMAILTAAPIAFRRKVPLLALVVSCAAVFVLVTTHGPEGTSPIGVAVLVYSVAAWAPMRRAGVGLGVLVLTLIGMGLLGDGALSGVDVAFSIGLFSIVWSGGVAMRARRDAADARVREATEQFEIATQRSMRAVAEERLRIAQELHDVVAHSISVIAVQSGVATHFLDENPDETRAALDAIGRTSRATLGELRRLLGVLRGDDGHRSHAPAPTLGEVPDLVDEMRALGLPITLEVAGEGDAEHRAIEMSAYRVVQEALTNVLKHAGPTTRVTVRVAHRDDGIDVWVEDDGRGAGVAAHSIADQSSHHGLIGMRERVDVWGGELRSGPRPGGGFTVHANFPFEDAS
jgi:signal transduction histidine kinase